MAYNFGGTFNASQFARFLAFAKGQLPLVQGRIQHLEAEIARVGAVVFRYNKGIPQGYSADPPESYLGKLLAAYEVLGGNPFIDLRIRLRNDPVFLLRGTETRSPQTLSNGEIMGAKGLSDAPTSELMHEAKFWIDSTMQYRFDGLERKIRRMVDYADELRTEAAQLGIISKAASTPGSLEYIAAQVAQYLSDQNYRAIYDDGGGDKFGLNVYAPFSSYDVGNARTAESAQRQNTGFVGPGQSGVA